MHADASWTLGCRFEFQMSQRSQPSRFFLTCFAVLSGVLAVSSRLALDWPWLWSALIAVNAAAFCLWSWDKLQAVRSGWRVPEITLHTMAALGATPASFAAMLVLRHKIRKPHFWGLYVTLTVLQVAIFFYLNGRFDAA